MSTSTCIADLVFLGIYELGFAVISLIIIVIQKKFGWTFLSIIPIVVGIILMFREGTNFTDPVTSGLVLPTILIILINMYIISLPFFQRKSL